MSFTAGIPPGEMLIQSRGESTSKKPEATPTTTGLGVVHAAAAGGYRAYCLGLLVPTFVKDVDVRGRGGCCRRSREASLVAGNGQSEVCSGSSGAGVYVQQAAVQLQGPLTAAGLCQENEQLLRGTQPHRPPKDIRCVQRGAAECKDSQRPEDSRKSQQEHLTSRRPLSQQPFAAVSEGPCSRQETAESIGLPVV